jgi:hypothetical protein
LKNRGYIVWVFLEEIDKKKKKKKKRKKEKKTPIIHTSVKINEDTITTYARKKKMAI